MYNKDYEEYMRSVLGYNPTNEIYNNTYNIGYDRNVVEYGQLYPEIYNKLNPVVSRICSMNTKPINDVTLNEMVEAIIANVNLDEYMELVREEPKLKNGDVRNPRAKETNEGVRRKPSRLLKELIRIMILDKMVNFNNYSKNYINNIGNSNTSGIYQNDIGNKYTIF